jgi:hypothetical protein
VVDVDLLQRAVEVYEVHLLDFADAYLVASAERTGVGVIASFDRTIRPCRDGPSRVAQVRPPWPGSRSPSWASVSRRAPRTSGTATRAWRFASVRTRGIDQLAARSAPGLCLVAMRTTT